MAECIRTYFDLLLIHDVYCYAGSVIGSICALVWNGIDPGRGQSPTPFELNMEKIISNVANQTYD